MAKSKAKNKIGFGDEVTLKVTSLADVPALAQEPKADEVKPVKPLPIGIANHKKFDKFKK